MDKEVVAWLLEGPPWVKYAVELQLLKRQPDPKPALKDSAVTRLIARLKDSNNGLATLKTGKIRYTEPGKAYWDLFFLADIGFTLADLGLEKEASQIFAFQNGSGAFNIPPNVQPHYFCMSAILISSLAQMGYKDDPRLAKYIRLILQSQGFDGGWNCYEPNVTSCPMDNLNILMLLGQYEQYRENPLLYPAQDALLDHWQERSNLHGFGIGRRFRSLQYPAVKYGILRVLDVLSLFPHAVEQPRFQEMLAFARGKADGGRYFAELTESAYAEFDFGQTRDPSRWLTFLVNRIDKRVNL